MNGMVTEITLDDIKIMQGQLRTVTKSWVKKMVPKMKDGDEPEKATESRIYNICSAVVSSQDWRTRFILKGKELINELGMDNNVAMEIINEMKNS